MRLRRAMPMMARRSRAAGDQRDHQESNHPPRTIMTSASRSGFAKPIQAGNEGSELKTAKIAATEEQNPTVIATRTWPLRPNKSEKGAPQGPLSPLHSAEAPTFGPRRKRLPFLLLFD
jgi:hypothetical protein